MKGKKRNLVILTGVLLLFLSVLVVGCGGKKEPAASNPTATQQPGSTGNNAEPTKAPEVDPDAAAWKEVTDAAAKEGKLLLNMPNGEYVRTVISAFEKAHPEIKVEYTQLQGKDFTPRINAERNAGQYLWDVYVGGGSTVYKELLPMGALVDFPRDLPETKPSEELDKLWRDDFEYGFSDEEGKYAFAFGSFLQYSIAVNREIIPESEFNSPEDLLNPKWKGKITWQAPEATGAGSLVAAQLLNAHGEEYLRNVFKQDIVTTDNRRQHAEWVFRGAYPIALAVSQAEYDLLRSELSVKVEPIELPGFAREAFGSTAIALIKDAPHPNAAKVFINWLLSKEGQTVHAEASKLNTRRLDVPVADEATLIKEAGQNLLTTNKQENEALVQRAIEIVKEELK